MRLFLLVLLSLIGTSLAKADDAILILDASKSMWGKVEGKTKVEIARSVVSDLLTQIPAERRVGFVAYGHRRASDCKDIEQIVPVGGERSAIRAALAELGFKGKTPLTAAVQFAAEQLAYTKSKATVILVSDGIESCHADPCAAAAALEKAGADLTVHVVGFGLKKSEIKGLKCLADATGGKYFSANNAAELSGALQRTVVAAVPEEPVDGQATVSAPARVEVGKSFEVRYTGPNADRDMISLAELNSHPDMVYGVSGCAFDPSGKDGKGELFAPTVPGKYEVRYVLSRKKIAARSILEVTPAVATVHGPESVAAGADFEVSWTGPGNTNDAISLTAPNARAGRLVSIFGNSLDARGSGGKGLMSAPTEPGAYELHYDLRGEEVLARQAFVVVPTQATLKGPSSVPAGSDFEVHWTGPNNSRDFVSLARTDLYDAHYESRIDASRANGAGTLHAPAAVGTYELRYVLRGDVKIATAPIVVTDVSATFRAPRSVGASQFFELGWTGPNNNGDLVLLSAVGSRDDMNVDSISARTVARRLRAPEKPGEYELRYYLDRQRVIGTQAITVSP